VCSVTRQLHVISDEAQVFEALRSALAGGPAILPGNPKLPVPSTVEQRIAVVVETSGSTGAPKRVALSANALLASAAASEAALGGTGQWLLALPTHYIAGINVLVRSIAADTSPVILPPGHFEATTFFAASRQMDAALRFTSLVPVQLSRLVERAETDIEALEQLRRFDRILVGGQASSPILIARCLELGLNVTRTYGSSETSGGCIYDGVPIGSAETRIVDGEVHISGPMLAELYLDDPAKTEATFVMAEGKRWYRTGDTGTIVEGVLAVTGRLDSIIISGGEKVSLDAIEHVIHHMDGLGDAVAVRAPSAEWGEVPVVFSSGNATLAEVKATVVAQLGKASAPVAFIRVESVPLLPGGKPDRVGLTAFAASRGAVPTRRQ
jgi:O-succinylbenzoic acid--CoA ligase